MSPSKYVPTVDVLRHIRTEFLTPKSASLWQCDDALRKRIVLNKVPLHRILGEAAVRSFLSDMTSLGVLKTNSVNLIPEGVVSPFTSRRRRITVANVFNEAPGVKDVKEIICADGVAHDKDENLGVIGVTDEVRQRIDAVYDVLGQNGMAVPVRKRDRARGEHERDNRGEVVAWEPVRARLTRADVRRYLVACEQDVAACVVRLVESAAWRGVMFPVDERSCRIELQSGQFFQQGRVRTFHVFVLSNVNAPNIFRSLISAGQEKQPSILSPEQSIGTLAKGHSRHSSGR